MAESIQQTADIIRHEFRENSTGKPAKRTAKSKGMTTDELSPLVKPGDYQLAYIGRYTAYMHGRNPKLALKFRIVDMGEFFEVELERWFNVKRLTGKPGNNGMFVPPRHGDFLLEYTTLFPTVLTRKTRLDRISFTPFRNITVTGTVGTVTKNSTQDVLPEVLQYSTIRKLLRAGA